MKRLALFPVMAVLCACPGPRPAAEVGAALFEDPALSDSQFNAVSCATCHDATGAILRAERIFTGHPLRNSAFRSRYWGGARADLLEAVNDCYTLFMRGGVPMTAAEPRAKALYEFLVSISPENPSAPLPFTVIKDIVDVPNGDATEGEALYGAACAVCHGTFGDAVGKLDALTPALPAVFGDYAEVFPDVPARVVVIEKIRHGQFFGIGGTMPLYSTEVMSDAEVGAILAYFGL